MIGIDTGLSISRSLPLNINRLTKDTVVQNEKMDYTENRYIQSYNNYNKEISVLSNEMDIDVNDIDNIECADDMTIEELKIAIKSRGVKENTKVENDKIQRIKEERNNMYAGAIASSYITINSLYANSFGTDNTNTNKPNSEEIDKVVSLNGMSENDKWAVGKLMELNIDVNKSSVNKLQNIKDIVDGLEEYDNNLDEMEDIGLIDKQLMEDNKVLYTDKDIATIVDDLGKLSDSDIANVVNNNKEVTIGNLRAVLNENTDKVIGNNSLVSEKVIDCKEQINQIRAQLNTEAAIKISDKLPLESSEISKVAEELKIVNNEVVELALDKVDVPKTEENKTIISDTLQAINRIKHNKVIATTVEIETGGKSELSQIDNIIKTYGLNRLEPDSKFGDSISKIGNDIKELLKSLNIDVDTENIECAKALILNNLDITIESMNNVKAIMSKINTLIEDMAPDIAAKMIKEGINPYKSSLNSLLEYTIGEKVPRIKETVAEAIVKLDDTNSITKGQKDSLIGLYKIINSLDKHKEKIVGYLAKDDREITLERINQAIKYIDKYELDVSIDNNFGELTEIIENSNNAKELINSGIVAQEQMQSELDKLENTKIDTDKGHKIYKIIKKMVKDYVDKDFNQLPNSTKEKIDYIKNIDQETIEVMKKSDIPITINNIYLIDKLIKDKETYSKVIKESSLSSDNDRNLDSFDKDIEEAIKENERIKESMVLAGDKDGYKHYKQVEETLKTLEVLKDREGIYQIPFIVDGETRNVSMYLNKNKTKQQIEESGLNAVIAYDTKTMGRVKATLNIKGDSITYSIDTEKEEYKDKINKNINKIISLLDSIGYNAQRAKEKEVVENKVDDKHSLVDMFI